MEKVALMRDSNSYPQGPSVCRYEDNLERIRAQDILYMPEVCSRTATSRSITKGLACGLKYLIVAMFAAGFCATVLHLYPKMEHDSLNKLQDTLQDIRNTLKDNINSINENVDDTKDMIQAHQRKDFKRDLENNKEETNLQTKEDKIQRAKHSPGENGELSDILQDTRYHRVEKISNKETLPESLPKYKNSTEYIGTYSRNHPCPQTSTSFTKSPGFFPDVDYAFMGYNSLKGYPLEEHDPGFAFPIFKIDYSSDDITGDCQYNVPRGLIVAPNVSCVTSFTSTVVSNTYEFAESLSMSSEISFGDWGINFAASSSYKMAMETILSGKYKYVFTKATCSSYFSKLIADNAPEFDENFLAWVKRLQAYPGDRKLYIRFFDTYGTHFPTDIVFGAKFVYEFKLKTSTFKKMISQDASIRMDANYAAAFSIGAGFKMDASMKERAEKFLKQVSYKIVTIGSAPPTSQDASVWAYQVKKAPEPIKYSFESIEELFTDKYMKNMKIEYSKIRKSILRYKHDYCLHLLNKGLLKSCKKLEYKKPPAVIDLQYTRLHNHFKVVKARSLHRCIDACEADRVCQACTFNGKTCWFYYEGRTPWVSHDNKWQSAVLIYKIMKELHFKKTRIADRPITFSRKIVALGVCKNLCRRTYACVAVTYNRKSRACFMFGADNITGLDVDTEADTYFFSASSSLAQTDSGNSTIPTRS